MLRFHYQLDSCTFDNVSEEVNCSLKLVATFYCVSFHLSAQFFSIACLKPIDSNVIFAFNTDKTSLSIWVLNNLSSAINSVHWNRNTHEKGENCQNIEKRSWKNERKKNLSEGERDEIEKLPYLTSINFVTNGKASSSIREWSLSEIICSHEMRCQIKRTRARSRSENYFIDRTEWSISRRWR